MPLSKSLTILEFLVPLVPDVTSIDRILDIIAPAWVDLHAARWIAVYARMDDHRPAVVLNASSKFAAEMYIRRASCRPSKTSWQLVPITSIHGESVFDDIALEIWQALLSSFADVLIPDPFEDDIERQLAQLLFALQKRGRPAIIVLKFTSRSQLFVPQLQERFPYLCFLFLSGTELPDEQSCPTSYLHRLEPALNSGQEEAARDEFITARSIIRPRG